MKFQYLFFFFFLLNNTLTVKSTCNPSCKQLWDCNDTNCIHKELFPDWRPLDVVGLLLVLISCIFANVAGIGGGPFFMPICLLIFQFELSQAVAVSSAIIFGVQFIRFFISYWERHPKADRPAVDYTLAALFSPSTILGTVFGALLNQWLPDWFTLILIVILMIFNFYLTLKKGLQILKKEKEIKIKKEGVEEEIAKAKVSINERKAHEIKSDSRENNIKVANISNLNHPLLQAQEITTNLEKILEKEARPYHFDKLFAIIISIIIATVLTLFKGSKKSKSIIGVSNCSGLYWLITFAFVPISIAIIYLLAKLSIKENEAKINNNFPFLESDLKLTIKVAIKLSFYGFFVGLLGAMLGIGGGIIVGPLFLEMKLDPTVSSYTSAFLAFFTAASSTIQYVIWGQLVFDYSGFAIIFGIAGGLIGIYGILTYVKKYSRQSIIVLTLAFVLVLSCVSMIYSGVNTILEDKDKGKNIWAFKSIC